MVVLFIKILIFHDVNSIIIKIITLLIFPKISKYYFLVKQPNSQSVFVVTVAVALRLSFINASSPNESPCSKIFISYRLN